jgi:hypothetical protein
MGLSWSLKRQNVELEPRQIKEIPGIPENRKSSGKLPAFEEAC